MKIKKYTIGMGDRFAHQGRAQLSAVMQARELGIPVSPVWNKSNREHTIVHSKPDDLRAEADEAVAGLGWKDAYYVDADHIGLKTVDGFLQASNFFTLDVADFVGKPSAESARFHQFIQKWGNDVLIPGMGRPLDLSPAAIEKSAAKFLQAMIEAGAIYRHILANKTNGEFVVEVSVDETDSPQTPDELFLILAMLAMENVPVQTIAPKFTGRFNKGVDYVGDLAQFEKEFDEDIAVLAFAVKEFGLPSTLKLSVHSGSDKFSIYPIINKLVKKHGCGLHVKTAGTTWLEEVIGLADADGDALAIAKEIYSGAHSRFAELTGPYATVIDIDPGQLPSVESVGSWTSEQFVAALRHDRQCPDYNPHFRQLIHVGFKVAAELGPRYTNALKAHAGIVGSNVTNNLLERHIKPIFS
jgi:tagaturonate epimerase